MPNPYGSSPYINRVIVGITGPTGNTGPLGPTGNEGLPGNTGNTGNTGLDITGMTLINGEIQTTFSDGSVQFGAEIQGAPGNYYIFVDAKSLGSEGLSLTHGLTINSFGEDSLQHTVRFRGFTTGSQNDNLKFITINSSETSNVIGITYSLTGLPYLGLSGGSTGQLVIANSSTSFYGFTGTYYDTIKRTVDAQIINYGERVKFVRPQQKTFTTLDGDPTNSQYFIWNIDWKEANTFIINSFTDQLQSGQPGEGKTTIAQVIRIENPPSTEFAKSLTIIVPSGVTSGVNNEQINLLTEYISVDNITLGYTFGEGTNNISWPLTFSPCFSENIDVINMLYINGIWYANYGLIENQTNQIDWQSKYFTCIPDIEDPAYDPNLKLYGLCCNECTENGGSFYGTNIECQGVFIPKAQVGDPRCSYTSSQLGICCYKNSLNEIFKFSNPIPICDCSELADNVSTNFIWTSLDDCRKNIDSIDCSYAFSDTGACCSGFGSCTENTTKADCEIQGHYWQGIGSVCSYNDNINLIEICKTGTGGCCDGTGTCTDTLYQNCDTIGGSRFYGCSYTCTDTNVKNECLPQKTPYGCISENNENTPIFRVAKYNTANEIIGYTDLKLGDFFAGGVVVGIFNPNGQVVLGNRYSHGAYTNAANGVNDFPISIYDVGPVDFGNPSFAESVFQNINSGAEQSCKTYNTIYDPMGYGFTLADSSQENDSWLMIVLPWPARIHQAQLPDLATGIERVYHTIPYVDNTIPTDTTQTATSTTHTGYDNSYFKTYYDIMQISAPQYIIETVNVFYDYYDSVLFNWSVGGLAAKHCFTLDDDLNGSFTSLSFNEDSCPLLGSYIAHDGFYGTNAGSTYYGTINGFDTCTSVQDTCTVCLEAPLKRSQVGQSFNITRTTGYWSRNWGIFNTCALFASEIATYYLIPTTTGSLGGTTNGSLTSTPLSFGGHPTVGLNNIFARGLGAASFGYGLGSDFERKQFSTNIIHLKKCTIAEGTSSYNKYYYSSEKMVKDGYPQVSRWYVPSIDELAFLAKQSVDFNLQTKILNYDITNTGIPLGQIGDGYVWSSTGTFDETDPSQFKQGDTIAEPNPNNDITDTSNRFIGIGNAKVACDPFTKAWAIKFPEYNDATPPSSNQFLISKKDNGQDRLELRLVRLIRCDQRYYDNNSPEKLRNRTWMVPRLSDAVICEGVAEDKTASGSSNNRTTFDASNHPEYSTPESNVLYKNNPNNSNPV